MNKSTGKSESKYIKDIKKRISRQMPKIIAEVEVYEKKLIKGQLNSNPKTAPQFNG